MFQIIETGKIVREPDPLAWLSFKPFIRYNLLHKYTSNEEVSSREDSFYLEHGGCKGLEFLSIYDLSLCKNVFLSLSDH